MIGPHGPGARTNNGFRFLDFARGDSLRVAGTYYQGPEHHCWTLYSNTGPHASEIDHVLVGIRWRLLRNCRVFRRAQFDTDHRLMVAELRIRIRSKRWPSGDPVFDIVSYRTSRPWKSSAARSEDRGSCLDWAGGSWQRESFCDRLIYAAHETLGTVAFQRRQNTLLSEVADLVNIRRCARLNGDRRLYWSLRKTVSRTLRVVKKPRSGMSVGGYRSTCLRETRGQPSEKSLLSGKTRPQSHVPFSILSEDCKSLEGPQALKRFAGYFKGLLDVPPPSTEIDTSGITPLTADPPINTSPSSLSKIEKGVGCSKSGKAAGVFNIRAELLKAAGVTVL